MQATLTNGRRNLSQRRTTTGASNKWGIGVICLALFSALLVSVITTPGAAAQSETTVDDVTTLALDRDGADTFLAQTADRSPIAVIEALDASLNAGDVESALALWADDGEARQNPPQPGATGLYQGRDQVRTFLESIVAQHIQFELAAPRQADGDQVTWTNNTSIDPWRQLGIAPLQGTAVATVQDGKITTFAVTLTPESIQKLQQAIATAPRMPSTGGGGTALTQDSESTISPIAIAGFGLVAMMMTALVIGRMRSQRPFLR